MCLFAFFERDHHNYFLACTQLIISGKSVSQYASYSLIFSPLLSIINGEQHESISIINPAITQNILIVKMYALVINIKVGMLI